MTVESETGLNRWQRIAEWCGGFFWGWLFFGLLVALPASAQTATVCEVMLTDQHRERIAADRSLEIEAVPMKSVYVSQADWVTISMALGGFIQIHGIPDRQVGFAPGEWASFDCRTVSARGSADATSG